MSPYNKIIGLILGNAILSFVILLFFFTEAFTNLNHFLWAYTWAFAICSTQWIGHGYISVYLNQKYDWIDDSLKRTAYGVIYLVVYAIGAFIIVQIIMYYLYYGKLPDQMWNWILKSLFFPATISFGLSLIFTSYGFFRAWKSSVVKAERLKTEMMTYKYESLRNQINPHFLFNSFNVLSELIYDDQKVAVRFVQQMSGLFRYVLDSRDKELVTLKEESDFLNSYAYLLKTRFEDKLSIDINLNIQPDDYIVPMSLQLLLENAVKHNEVSEAFPLHISITRNNDLLEVRNGLKLKHVGDDSKETGLKNIKQQYGYFTKKPIEIVKTDLEFIARIPIIKHIEE